MIWLLPRPFPPLPIAYELSLFLSLPVCCRSSLLTGEGGAKSYNGENAWSTILHSILSGFCYVRRGGCTEEGANSQLALKIIHECPNRYQCFMMSSLLQGSTLFRLSPITLSRNRDKLHHICRCSCYSTLKKISVMHVIKLGFAPVSFPPG